MSQERKKTALYRKMGLCAISVMLLAGFAPSAWGDDTGLGKNDTSIGFPLYSENNEALGYPIYDEADCDEKDVHEERTDSLFLSYEVPLISIDGGEIKEAAAIYVDNEEDQARLLVDALNGRLDNYAEESVAHSVGTCVWSIDSNGCMTISPKAGMGTGYLTSTTTVSPSWSYYGGSIKSISFSPGVKAGKPDKSINLKGLFKDLAELESVEGLENFDVSNVVDMSSMFEGCSKLKQFDYAGLTMSNVKNINNMFSGCTSLQSVRTDKIATPSLVYVYSLFEDCTSLSSIDLSGFDTSNVTSFLGLFENCSSLGNVDLGPLDASHVTSFASMFKGCAALQSINMASLSSAKVKDARRMFSGCASLKELDLSTFETENIEQDGFCSMFADCSALESLDLQRFDTRNSTSMSGMFRGCSALSALDVSGFDTSGVTAMDSMFDGCSALEELDLSSFDTSKVENMMLMFSGCGSLKKINLANFNTSQTTMFAFMFANCSSLLELDLRSFNTLKAKESSFPLLGCSSLRKITLGTYFNLKILLPTPSSENIPEADGYWYGASGKKYVASIPARRSETTFYSYPPQSDDGIVGDDDGANDQNNNNGNTDDQGGSNKPVEKPGNSSDLVNSESSYRNIANSEVYINGCSAADNPKVARKDGQINPQITLVYYTNSANSFSSIYSSHDSISSVGVYYIKYPWSASSEKLFAFSTEIVTYGANGKAKTQLSETVFANRSSADSLLKSMKENDGASLRKGFVANNATYLERDVSKNAPTRESYEANNLAESGVSRVFELGPAKGKDYDVSFDVDLASGIGKATISGKGSYYGSKTVSFLVVDENTNGTGIPGDAQAGTTNRTNTTTPLVQTGASTANGSSSGKTGLVQTGDVVGYSAAGASLLAILAVSIIVGWKRKHASVAMGPQEKEASFDLANADFETKKKAFYHDKLDKMIPKL